MRSNLVERVYLVCCLAGRGLGSSGVWGCQPGWREAVSPLGHPNTSSGPCTAPVPPPRPAPFTPTPSRAEGKRGGRQSSLPGTPPACVPCQLLAAAGSEAL